MLDSPHPPSTRAWHGGPPPHIGWWNASAACQDKAWRWWNGAGWSESAFDDHSDWGAAIEADRLAPGHQQTLVRWTTHWPARARVPRMAP